MREFIIKFSDADAEQLIEGMEEARENEIIRCFKCKYYSSLCHDDEGYCDFWEREATDSNGFCHEGKPEDYTVEPIYSLDQFFNHPIEKINDLIEGTKGGIKSDDDDKKV